MAALFEPSFRARAHDLIHPGGQRPAVSSIRTGLPGDVPKTTTHHTGIHSVPGMITHLTPRTIVENFYPAVFVARAVLQTDYQNVQRYIP